MITELLLWRVLVGCMLVGEVLAFLRRRALASRAPTKPDGVLRYLNMSDIEAYEIRCAGEIWYGVWLKKQQVWGGFHTRDGRSARGACNARCQSMCVAHERKGWHDNASGQGEREKDRLATGLVDFQAQLDTILKKTSE